MNGLFGAIDGVARAWGAWMFSMSWQVAIAVLVVALLTRIWRRRSAVLLHAIWLLVLARLVVPPDLSLPTGWGYWLLPASRPVASVTSEHSAPGPTRDNRAPDDGSEEAPENRRLTSEIDNREPAVAAAPGEPAASRLAAEAPAAWVSYLMLAWAGIAGTLLVFLGYGSLRVRRWVREAEPIDDPELYSLLEECRRRLGIARLIELRNSHECTTPVVVGLRRPVILLPKPVLSQLSRDEMQAVLLHELCHIVRGDAIVNLVQGILGALYFFHPLVWWANAALRRLREEACDELTVTALDGQRRTYGEALVKVTEIFGYASPPLALGVMESKSPARERLERILDPQLPQGSSSSWRTLAVVGMLAAVLLPGGARYSTAGGDGEGRVPVVQVGPPAETVTVGEPDVVVSRTAGDEARRNEADAEAIRMKADVPAPAERAKAPLRYRWEAGKSYAYSVYIEAEREDAVEMFSGTPLYTVRSTGNDGAEIVFSGRLMSSQKMKPRRQFPHVGPPPRTHSPFSPFSGVGIPTFPHEEHVLKLDERGSAVSVRGQSQLPFMLGNLSQLMIVRLPSAGEQRWESDEKSTVSIVSEGDRFPRPRFGPFARTDEGERLEARERVASTLEPQAEPGVVVIRREYQLRTSESRDGQPRFEISGTCRVSFDTSLGLPTRLAGEFKWVQNSENVTRRVPIIISAKLLSEVERRELEEARKEAARRKPLDEDALDRALGDLTAKDAVKVQNAAGILERAEPGNRREDVARALAARLGDRENNTRQAVARALVVWGTAESVPALIEALDDEYFPIPWAALEALGKLQDPRGVAPVVQIIKAKKHRLQAVQSLSAMGALAEREVLPLLDEPDSDVRYDACRVLKSVGGNLSIEPLRNVTRNDDNSIVRLIAEQALTEIEKRGE